MSENRIYKRPYSPGINLSLRRRVAYRNQSHDRLAKIALWRGGLLAMHRLEPAGFETVQTLAQVRAEREGPVLVGSCLSRLMRFGQNKTVVKALRQVKVIYL